MAPTNWFDLRIIPCWWHARHDSPLTTAGVPDTFFVSLTVSTGPASIRFPSSSTSMYAWRPLGRLTITSPPAWTAAVIQAFLDGEAVVAAAERLGITRANFDQRKKRALDALQECVEPRAGGASCGGAVRSGRRRSTS